MDISKLGITPGPWRHSEGMGYIFANRVGGCQMKMQNMTVANTRGYGCLKYHGEEKAHAEMKANEYLIASAPGLLDNLITGVLMVEKQDKFIPIDSEEYSFRNNSIDTIEKACYPKKWDEIKKILGENNG